MKIVGFGGGSTSSDLKRSVTPKANMNPTYLALEVSKNI